jgi:hypothetical protein
MPQSQATGTKTRRKIEAAHQQAVLLEQFEHGGPALEQGPLDHVARGHVAHVVGHGAEDAEGRELHDEVRVLEHGLGYAVEEGQYGLAAFAHLGEGDAEERREDHHGEDVAFRGMLDQVRREQVEGDLPARLRLDHGHRRVGAQVHGQVGAGLQPVGHAQPDEEGQGGDDLEVEQGLGAHAAHGPYVPGLGDAHDDGGQQQGHDQPFDEADEGLGKEPEEVVGPRVLVLGQEAPQHHAQEQAQEDPEGAGAVPGSLLGHGFLGWSRGKCPITPNLNRGRFYMRRPTGRERSQD